MPDRTELPGIIHAGAIGPDHAKGAGSAPRLGVLVRLTPEIRNGALRLLQLRPFWGLR
jgi:hypothetical protein